MHLAYHLLESTKTHILLQGVGSSIQRLKEGKLHTPTVHALSLASILRPIVQSGDVLPELTYT